MQVPLYQAKAEFFRMLGHPVRIRVLELLQNGPVPVRDLLCEIEIEPSSLSQQLAVLRRSGIVVSIREGSTVSYALAGGDVAELLRAARRILTELLPARPSCWPNYARPTTAVRPWPRVAYAEAPDSAAGTRPARSTAMGRRTAGEPRPHEGIVAAWRRGTHLRATVTPPGLHGVAGAGRACRGSDHQA
jgi:ArsR family transcriptional regulator